MMHHESKLLIAGALRDTAERFEVENPATEDIIGTAPDAGLAEAEAAILAARNAFDHGVWSRDSDLRNRTLQAFAQALQQKLDVIRPLLVAESGMPVSFAKMLGVDAAIPLLSRFIAMAAEIKTQDLAPASIFGRQVRREVRREAVGVVVAITPWNVPFELNLRKIGMALTMGNTVVLKPAPQTPWSATLMAEAALEAGFPPGVLNIITTTRTDAATLLTSHPAVDQVTFTGSTETGRRIMATAAPTIKRLGFELGGKSPAVILDDVQGFDAIIKGLAAGVCTLSGQGCTLLTRLLVPRARMEEAAALAAEAVGQVRIGDPTDPMTAMGPLSSAQQRQRVLGYMQQGACEARLICGGGVHPDFAKGYFMQPTVFADVPFDAVIAREEIFGPVLSLIAHDGDDDALRIANASDFGLSSAVFGSDPDRLERIASGLRAGVVSINGAPWFDAGAPFGGYKQSGLGREFGHAGLEEFTELKTLAFNA